MTAINAQQLQGQWSTLKGLVKERWGALTDDDLALVEGKAEELVGRIVQRTGEARETVEQFLSGLLERGASSVAGMAEAAGRYAHEAGDQLRAQYQDLSATAREQYEQARAQVRRQPAPSVAAAFGVGLVAGLIVGLALRSR